MQILTQLIVLYYNNIITIKRINRIFGFSFDVKKIVVNKVHVCFMKNLISIKKEKNSEIM